MLPVPARAIRQWEEILFLLRFHELYRRQQTLLGGDPKVAKYRNTSLELRFRLERHTIQTKKGY